MKIGIYEQIINQLFEEKISSIDQNRFYIGERVIKKDEVAKLLSMYLTSIFEQVLSDMVDINDETDEEDEQKDSSVKRGLELANSIIRKLVNEFHLDSGNLVSAQAKILTAVIDKTQSDYPDLAKRLEEMMPMKGLINGALFTGKGMKMYTELQKEIASADEIRLMVSFIKKRGLALILPRLKEFTNRGGVKLIEVQFEKLGIPQDLQRAIKTDLSKSNTDEAFGTLRFDDNLYLINLIDGEIKAKKLMTVHKKIDDTDVELFSLGDESDGTKRLFDYIPLILDLIQGGKVFVVDEMERSLHPALIQQIITLFYKYSKDVSSQLIFTTHESSLMNQKVFRKDEIWLMRKSSNGISSFGRMDNLYNVRFDKMLQNSYLNGEYGATPIFETEEEISKLFSTFK